MHDHGQKRKNSLTAFKSNLDRNAAVSSGGKRTLARISVPAFALLKTTD